MTYSLGTIERTVDRYVKFHHNVISIMHTSRVGKSRNNLQSAGCALCDW